MEKYFSEILKEKKESSSCRSLLITEQEGAYITVNNRKYLNFSSNDYLGISSDKQLQEIFLKTISAKEKLFGAGSSRLLTGNHPYYEELENLLAGLYKKESCLIFNSGYHANIGILPALSKKGDLIISDKLVHASIIDGIRLCSCENVRYKHLDMVHLEQILQKSRAHYDNVFVVTESVFSMDGDAVDLHAMIVLKKKYDFHIYLDEAHAFGVLGNKGLGLAEQENCIHEIDLLVGTFGKAAASQGAYVVCSKIVKEYLVNHSRSLIFTTALPPVNILWTKFVIEKLVVMNEQRKGLKNLAQQFYKLLDLKETPSNIVPYIVGENAACLKLSDMLKSNGFWCMPVRYPTVPAGTARLRFSLTSSIGLDDIKRFVKCLKSKNITLRTAKPSPKVNTE